MNSNEMNFVSAVMNQFTVADEDFDAAVELIKELYADGFNVQQAARFCGFMQEFGYQGDEHTALDGMELVRFEVEHSDRQI